MPTVTVNDSVTLEDAARVLKDRLGTRYDITLHGSGTQQALRVKESAAALATVHVDNDASRTIFHVHGGGLVITRMINEFGIAKKVSQAIQEAFTSTPDPGQA